MVLSASAASAQGHKLRIDIFLQFAAGSKRRHLCKHAPRCVFRCGRIMRNIQCTAIDLFGI